LFPHYVTDEPIKFFIIEILYVEFKKFLYYNFYVKVKTLTLKKNLIPEATIRRLSTYLRCLRISLEKGEEIVSSPLLAERCHVSESLIRRDLTYFGEFGIKGKGYKTKELIAAIEYILGIHTPIKVILLGCGSLGRAVLRHLKKVPYFDVVAAFDKENKKCGEQFNGTKILHISQLKGVAEREKPRMAVIAIPPEELQEAIDLLAKCGIKGILSFTLSQVKVPKNVTLNFVDIAAEMEFLFYKINQKQ